MNTRAEHGQIAAFVAIIAVSLIACAGLAFDGGRLLTARRELRDLADGAARAGAQALSVNQLRRNDTTAIDPTEATQAADAFLAAAGQHGVVTVDGATVTVTVRERVAMTLLAVVGVRARDIQAQGHAQLVRGVTRGDS